ncbi:MAG: M48 family metallopeptidase [Xanthobacteraceae bacterium]|nr:M48 family metallopeptidase [Xanthobacteraceae bacterium]MBX9842307.1 M48 family metallopeptidase [Xanthobacteraceae bacterium]
MAAAFGLYTHIQSNRRRSIALLLGLFFLVYLMVYAGALLAEAMMGDASLAWLLQAAWRDLIWAAPFATVATALWIAIAYLFNQSLIDAVTGASGVTRKEQPRLYNLLENLCISRGIPMPKLKVMDDPALNAFASGLNQKQYSITVTTGLLGRLNDQEVEAVLGHELTHIRNGDVRMLVIAVIIAGVIGFFAELVFRMFFQSGVRWSRGRSSSGGGSSDRGKGGGGAAVLIAIAIVAVAWLLSTAIRFALSRRREYLADAGAVELTKNPDAMIMALRKIEGRGELEGATSAVMEMCVDNPRQGFADLFATHPPIESRIKALIEFAGGHDPGPLDLPEPGDETQTAGEQGDAGTPPPKPFLPAEPPVVLGGSAPAAQPEVTGPPSGPWGPTRQ